jgi:hypothetical protein
MTALGAGAIGKSSEEVPSPSPQRIEEEATATGGRPSAHDALVSPDLGSSTIEVSAALPLLPPPPPQR